MNRSSIVPFFLLLFIGLTSAKAQSLSADNLFQLMMDHYGKTDVDSAELLYPKFIEQSKREKFNEGKKLLLVGTREQLQNRQFDVSILNFLKAEEYFTAHEDIRNFVLARKGRAASTYYQQLNEKALELFKSTYPFFDQIDLALQARIVSNVAAMHTQMSQHDEALKTHDKSLAIWDQVDDSAFGKSVVYGVRSYVYFELGDLENAIKDTEESKRLARLVNNDEQVAFVMVREAQILSAQGNYQAAIDTCLKAQQLYNDLELKQGIIYSNSILFQTYEKYEVWDSAFYAMERVYNAQKNVFDESMAENTSKYEVQFKTAEKEKELAESQLKLANRQKWIYGIVSGALALLFLGLWINQRNKRKAQGEKDRLRLEEQEQRMVAIIEAENKERSRIAQDLHDGVAQSMAAVRMRVSAWEDEVFDSNEIDSDDYEETLQLIDLTCDEVRSISHQMMPSVLNKKGLLLALKQLLEAFEKNAGIKTKFSHEFETTKRFPLITETTVYRIVQELLNNTYKHSGANLVDLTLELKHNRLQFVYTDNGKGIELETNSTDSTGLDNLKNRVKLVNGTIHLKSSRNQGVLYTIELPIHEL